jgi:hypothetical protein
MLRVYPQELDIAAKGSCEYSPLKVQYCSLVYDLIKPNKLCLLEKTELHTQYIIQCVFRAWYLYPISHHTRNPILCNVHLFKITNYGNYDVSLFLGTHITIGRSCDLHDGIRRPTNE